MISNARTHVHTDTPHAHAHTLPLHHTTLHHLLHTSHDFIGARRDQSKVMITPLLQQPFLKLPSRKCTMLSSNKVANTGKKSEFEIK